MRMRKYFGSGIILMLMCVITSCDNRKDWFELNKIPVTATVTMDGKTTKFNRGEERKIVLNYHINKEIYGDKITPADPDVIMAVIREYDKDNDLSSLYMLNIVDSSEKRVFSRCKMLNETDLAVSFIFNFKRDANYNWFDSDTEAATVYSTVVHATVYDIYENELNYLVEVNVMGDIPPTPKLEIGKVRNVDGYEYELSMEKSFDNDGKVLKYEWCIDGNIVPYEVSDPRFESNDGPWQAGKAAYGGTYIKSTSVPSVNHTFQNDGVHVVYYRCMDDFGAWSMWYKEVVVINE